MAEFRLLGPVELWVDGRVVDVGQRRQRAMLAALLVDAGQVVPWDALVERVWGDAAPANPRASLRAHATGIRRALTESGIGATLWHRSGGYLLDIDRDRVDLHRFRRLVHDVGTADDAGRAAGRAAALRAAVQLWRGPPLGGLDGPWVDRMRSSLTQERLDAVVAWADAELAVGNAAPVVGPLADLADGHPMAESVTAVLMRALDAVGRRAEALDRYTRLCHLLAEEFGVDPAPEVRAVFLALTRSGAEALPGPAQLPADLSGFVGRAGHLARLDGLLSAGEAPGSVVVAVIAGSPAVGKTTLAVHWAHRVAHRFPDGQLYVDLRGFSPDGRAVTPVEAVRRFLDAFGIPAGQTPADPDARTALYRSVLAGKRVLVVVDNARDADQVRPLLPDAPGCLAVVTSRNQLRDLVAEGARPFTLDVLSVAESRELLAARVGTDRVTGEPAATDDIIGRCARLPLALAVVAARAATASGSLHGLAESIRDGHSTLDALHGGDAVTDVRTVFSWSYQALPPAERDLFTLLGVHLGPDTSPAVAASLAGASPARVRRSLDGLVRAHLLIEHVPGRFTFHDLLRAYAADLASTMPGDDRRRAIRRLLDHYLHTAYAAARQLDDTRDPLQLAAPAPGVTVERPGPHWFEAERAGVLAAIDLASTAGFDTHVWQLAWTLYDVLDRQGWWHEQVTVQRAAVAATGRLADLPARGRAHRNLANAYTRLGRFGPALAELEHALAVCGQTGDPVARAHTHLNLAFLHVRSEGYAEALAHTRHALPLYTRVGHRLGTAEALSKMGWCQILLGDHRRGLATCERALLAFEELGDTFGMANTLSTLGHAHHRLGDQAPAASYLERASVLFRDIGDRFEEATALNDLGDAHRATGHTGGAHGAWSRALAVLTDLGHPDADDVRAKLHDLDRFPEGQL